MNYKKSICIILLLITNRYIYSSSNNNQSDKTTLTRIDRFLAQKHPNLEKHPALQGITDNRILFYYMRPNNPYSETARIAHRFVIAKQNILDQNDINTIHNLVNTLTQPQAEAFKSINSALTEA